MTTQKPARKFKPSQNRIEALKKENPRFRRVFSEYEIMAAELWNLENTSSHCVPDDFLEATRLQTQYLEDEIGHWLSDTENA